MFVKLIRYTGEPERTVAMAARLCYSPVGASELEEKMTVQQILGLTKKLAELKHLSPFEHISFTFAVEGISRTLTHQLVRHRIASYSQQSQRYVEAKNLNIITPPSIAQNSLAVEKFNQAITQIEETYKELIKLGITTEDARYILPNATETKIVITMNARSLFNFFALRCCQRAQWEIRIMAEKMLKAVREVAPNIFAKAGATCISEGYCPEGAMTCGLLEKLQAGGKTI